MKLLLEVDVPTSIETVLPSGTLRTRLVDGETVRWDVLMMELARGQFKLLAVYREEEGGQHELPATRQDH